MPSSLSRLLNRFLDIYKRDIDALHRQLDDPNFADTEGIPLHEQLALLSAGERAAQEKIRRNTLIDTMGNMPRHVLLQRDLGDSRDAVGKSNSEMILESLVKEAGSIAPNDNFSDRARLWQSQDDTAVELLRFFAARIDTIANAFDLLPEQNFEAILPAPARTLFRECHVSIAIGSTATCCILCGALLESALKYAMPLSEEVTRFSLVSTARARGYITDLDSKSAVKILKDRDFAVHGNPRLNSVSVQDAYKTLLATRNLIGKLYANREVKEEQ
jgi:hypothetical protein